MRAPERGRSSAPRVPLGALAGALLLHLLGGHLLGGCGPSLLPRFQRFEGPRQQQSTFRTAPVVISYPNGDYEGSGEYEPYDADAVVLRTEVEVFNGTDQPMILCRELAFYYSMPPQRCVYIEIADTESTLCGDVARGVQTLAPGQGARFEVCGVLAAPPPTTTVRALHLDAFRDAGVTETSWEYDSELWTASEPLPVVAAPAFPVWRGSYPERIEGRLEMRPASHATATHRAGDDDVGWIVSLTFSVKNATDAPLVIDTASVRALAEAPRTEAWTVQECGQGMERLDPHDRSLRTLAPGEMVEQRFAWWLPSSRYDDNNCYFESPTRVQLRLPGVREPMWLPVRR